VNLGNPVEYSMLELAETIISLTGSKSGLKFLPAPMDDPRRRQPDIALAKDKLGWAPQVGLKEGLQRTIGYFRELLSEP
jgi:UDP-glucuronate decarboxylase